MRQFYLLLGEWYDQMRREDERWYRLMCCWVKAPPFGEVFPVWATNGEPKNEDYNEDEDDDETAFRQVTAALTQYGN